MFKLSADQEAKLAEFVTGLPKAQTGAAGGRLTYSFTPTGLGTIVMVEDAISKQKVDLTDYGY